MSDDVAELLRTCECLPPERLRSVIDYSRFLLACEADEEAIPDLDPPTPAQQDLLRERLADHRSHPDDAEPWPTVRDRVRGSL